MVTAIILDLRVSLVIRYELKILQASSAILTKLVMIALFLNWIILTLPDTFIEAYRILLYIIAKISLRFAARI